MPDVLGTQPRSPARGRSPAVVPSWAVAGTPAGCGPACRRCQIETKHQAVSQGAVSRVCGRGAKNSSITIATIAATIHRWKAYTHTPVIGASRSPRRPTFQSMRLAMTTARKRNLRKVSTAIRPSSTRQRLRLTCRLPAQACPQPTPTPNRRNSPPDSGRAASSPRDPPTTHGQPHPVSTLTSTFCTSSARGASRMRAASFRHSSIEYRAITFNTPRSRTGAIEKLR